MICHQPGQRGLSFFKLHTTKNMKQLFILILLLFTNSAQAIDWQDKSELGKLFTDAGLEGTFVLYDVDADRFIGHNRPRAETRFTPASTFKIVNSLIGLEVGAVGSVDEILPYGGKPQPNKAWERNMSLRDAIKLSNVPIYQELARRIGLERMREKIAKLDYGNGDIGNVVDTFWLAGPLAINAVEQTQFLAHLAQDDLPFSDEASAQVKEIAKLDQGEGWALYGKTGSATRENVGWWVGWVQKGDKTYSFAMNVYLPKIDDFAQLFVHSNRRIELGKACLQALGVFGG
jgi:beta-lactamase class D